MASLSLSLFSIPFAPRLDRTAEDPQSRDHNLSAAAASTALRRRLIASHRLAFNPRKKRWPRSRPPPLIRTIPVSEETGRARAAKAVRVAPASLHSAHDSERQWRSRSSPPSPPSPYLDPDTLVVDATGVSAPCNGVMVIRPGDSRAPDDRGDRPFETPDKSIGLRVSPLPPGEQKESRGNVSPDIRRIIDKTGVYTVYIRQIASPRSFASRTSLAAPRAFSPIYRRGEIEPPLLRSLRKDLPTTRVNRYMAAFYNRAIISP